MSIPRALPLLALIATLGVPLAASAQTTASPAPAASGAPMTSHHHRHRRPSLMHALKSLDLSDAQQQQVTTFHSQEQQANQNADAATKAANARKMRAQIMGILTPDQKAKLATEMQHGHGMTGAGASAPDATASPAAQ